MTVNIYTCSEVKQRLNFQINTPHATYMFIWPFTPAACILQASCWHVPGASILKDGVTTSHVHLVKILDIYIKIGFIKWLFYFFPGIRNFINIAMIFINDVIPKINRIFTIFRSVPRNCWKGGHDFWHSLLKWSHFVV